MADRTDPERVRLFGTGGKLLEALKRLMCNLENLRCLELIDLMLDSKEALHLLDDICANCTQTMTKLVLINATKLRTPLIHVGVFLNLRVREKTFYIFTFFCCEHDNKSYGFGFRY